MPLFGEERSIRTSLLLLAFVLLVLANGFFVATAFALVSLRRSRAQQLPAAGDRRAAQVLSELRHLDTYLAATQLGIIIVTLALGWIGQPAVASLIEPLMPSLTFLPEAWREALAHVIAFAIGISTLTALHFLLGNLAPKSIALQRPEQTAYWAARPIHIFSLAVRPVLAGLNAVGNRMVRMFGIDPARNPQSAHSEIELRLAVVGSQGAGLAEAATHDLVERALLFPGLQARHVMAPRTELTAVPIDVSVDEVLAAAVKTGHSRLPVFEADLDHIVGVVDVKRLLPRLLAERAVGATLGQQPFRVANVMSHVLAVPETAPASDLLPRLRAAEASLAIVIDEYGGTAGLVTLVDLMERLVGDIADEYAPVSLNGRRMADGSVPLDGLTSLMEAREFYDLDLESEADVETVGGYVFSQLGRPALIGDEVLAPGGQILRVAELDGLRVAQVHVMPVRPLPGGAEAVTGSAA